MRTQTILPASPARSVQGPLLLLPEPISFWGGVEASSGMVIDGQSSKCGSSVANTVLAIAELRGSSSASAVLLELIYRDRAPAAILLAEVDAILVLGAITGREMGWQTPPILRVAKADLVRLEPDCVVEIDPTGHLSLRSW
jgi:predicted aconitase with swiveling domain